MHMKRQFCNRVLKPLDKYEQVLLQYDVQRNVIKKRHVWFFFLEASQSVPVALVISYCEVMI